MNRRESSQRGNARIRDSLGGLIWAACGLLELAATARSEEEPEGNGDGWSLGRQIRPTVGGWWASVYVTLGPTTTMFPPVKRYGDIDCESFEAYYSRWPAELSRIPKQVVQDWIHRHWHDFYDHWQDLLPQEWTFQLVPYTTAQIMAVDHIGAWIEELDAEGVEFVGTAQRSRTRLAQYMRQHGTFPVPIIVAKSAGHVIHPRSAKEPMREPYQLIEGHSRLACLRGMINAEWPTLRGEHLVWEVAIPRKSGA